MSTPESFPSAPIETPIIRVNNMGRASSPVQPPEIAEAVGLGFTPREEVSYGQQLIDKGAFTTGWTLTTDARVALNNVGYTDEELNSMNPGQILKLVDSDVGDLGFDLHEDTEASSENITDDSEKSQAVAKLGELGVEDEIAVARIATEENLHELVEHIMSGGDFISNGVDVRVEISTGPRGEERYSFYDKSTGRLMTSNMGKSRVVDEFARKVLDEGKTYEF